MNMDLLPVLFLFILVIAGSFCSLASSALTLIRTSRLTADKQRFFEKEKREELIFSLNLWNLLFKFCAGVLVIYGFASLPAAVLFLALILCLEVLARFIAAGFPEKALPSLRLLSVLALPWKLFYLLSKLKAQNNSGEEEFLQALEEGEKTGAVESRERSMVEGVLYLGDRPVSAFMTHRSEIEWLDIEAGIEEVREKTITFRAQGFFPVIRGSQDNIEGVVSVPDLLIALIDGASSWKGLEAIMKKPRFIPETLTALKAFEAFGQEEEYYLCVMDEYGGFAGSLRIKDLIDEIVDNENSPEAVADEEAFIRQEDGTWLADGSVSLDELAEVQEFEALGEEQGRDYHTLAGFIMKLSGEIPRTGEVFSWEQFHFTVLDKDGNRIDKVLISKI